MTSRAAETPWRDVALVLLTVLALSMLALTVYLRSDAAGAAASADEAEKRLVEDRDLAARYAAENQRRLVVSQDLTEAHSGEFISRAVRSAGITTGNITYGDPIEGTGKFAAVQITIDIKSMTFSALVSFLRQVETERPQLSLISGEIDRRGEDAWDGRLILGALIPAKPRS